jgi:hypothetical protein
MQKQSLTQYASHRAYAAHNREKHRQNVLNFEISAELRPYGEKIMVDRTKD